MLGVNLTHLNIIQHGKRIFSTIRQFKPVGVNSVL